MGISNIKNKPILAYFISLLLLSCMNQSSKKEIFHIKGDIKNLPEGKIELIGGSPWIVLDSFYTKDGRFNFDISNWELGELLNVKLVHYGKNSKTTFISFKTNVLIKGEASYSDIFILENGISIFGFLHDSTLLDTKTSIKYLDRPIKTGRQTQVMYNDSANFLTITKINKLEELIEQHPYSYYYLSQLKKRVANFDNQQFLFLLDHFDEDVQESKIGRELREYIENRHTKKLGFTTMLLNRESQKQVLLEKKAALNMVILWASWCGPCRKEIPQLKQVHSQFANNPLFNMVSVSLDDNKENWYKALYKEQMPWKQLLITPEATTYSKELFSFDGSIPTTLFVDNKGKIIKKFVGYDEKNLEEFTALIEQYTVSKK